MNNLDDKILKDFKNIIAISNLKEEFLMKKIFKKQIITMCILAIVVFSGGLLTVNAATNGKIVEDIKSTIYNMLKDNKDVNIDKDSIEIQNVEVDDDGNVETITYTF